MIHLDEFQLNEYLDGMLGEADKSAVEAHLAACAECRAVMEELQTLFAMLDEVEEVTLTTDLSARVLADLQPEVAPVQWLRPLLLAQLLGAAGMLTWLWPTVWGWLRQAGTAVRAITLEVALPQIDVWNRLTAWGTAALHQTQLARPALNLVSWQWAILLTLALVIWLAGNRLLFSNE
ncbi:MAG: anti-sigma factor family protein [Anaerolineae bacterium]